MTNERSLKGVDAAWYLASYPDVAAAGMDPQEHYDRFGRAEGRLPRPLIAQALEAKLWGGFSKIALSELEAWYHKSTTEVEEHRYSSWALARWYASKQDWSAAAALLENLAFSLPNHLGLLLLQIEVLLRLGHVAEAQAILDTTLEARGPLPDLCLAAANICRFTEDRLGGDANRLDWLNRMFAAAGLARISKVDPEQPLSLDNLTTSRLLPPVSLEPKVSVIMPAFNAAAFIATALRSLLAQTWRNLEILVVDDCSTDDTAAIVAIQAAKDQRVTLICQPQNRGAYAARNAALRRVSGDFITNHDSDDWSHPQRLEHLARALLAEPGRMGVMAHWARADSALHFQHWRMEQSLIHPTVSTLMFRREVLSYLGGWDEVEVAADTELWQRIKALYGADAVSEVLPGVPLAFARQLPGSLTNAPTTHQCSQFFGLRRLYRELSQSWHALAAKPNGLYLDLAAGERRFPAPPAILRSPPPITTYDLVLMGDFGDYPAVFPQTQALLSQVLAGGLRVALFHWPDYRQPVLAPMADHFLARAVEGQVDVLLPGQAVTADSVVVLGHHLLAKPLDILPHTRFQHCRVLELEMAASGLALSPTPIVTLEDRSLIEQSGQFCADWYLHHYPDVRRAGVDPLHHYLQHGHAEGREPGPNFNSHHYLVQCPEAADSGWPTLLHFLKAGRRLGYDGQHPHLPGALAHRKGRPTLLLCGHAAGEHLFGAERSLLDVLNALDELDINVLVSVPTTVNRDYIATLQQRSRQVFCIPTPLWSATEAPCPWAMACYAGIIRLFAVDAVQANTIVLREPLLAARQAGIPSLVHVRESLEYDADICRAIGLPAHAIRDQVLQLADFVLANSAFTARIYAKPEATHIVTNTVNLNALDIPNRVNPERIDITLIGSNLPKKGLADLLAVARLLEDTTPNARLLLIGPENAHTAALRSEQTIGAQPSNLVLVGYVPTPQKAIHRANIVLNLSHFQETFGRTILEGMAARRAVLAYAWGALPELIEDGVNGFLLPLGDVQAVADKLHWLCSNPLRIATMGEAGRRLALERFGSERMKAELRSVYRKSLKRLDI